MGDTYYDVGTGLAIPGLEAVMEYGDASTMKGKRLPDAEAFNDFSVLERVRMSNIDGIQADPDGRVSQQVNSDRHGEGSSDLMYAGRTIGLTGVVEAGSIPAVRDRWSRFSSQFGTSERDLIMHPPGEVFKHVNYVPNPEPWRSTSYWVANVTGGSVALSVNDFSSQYKVGLADATGATADGSSVLLRVGTAGLSAPTTRGNTKLWEGGDVYVGAYVKLGSGTSITAIEACVHAKNDVLATGSEIVVATKATPGTTNSYWIGGRLAASSIPRTTQYVGLLLRVKGSNGNTSLFFTRGMLLELAAADPTPVGYVGPALFGFSHQGVPGASASAGPLYSANMVHDPSLAEAQFATPPGWSNGSSGSVTTTQAPIIVPSKISGSTLDDAIYFHVVKDATSTSRIMQMTSTTRHGAMYGSTLNTSIPVAGGRTYRFSLIIDVAQKPTTDKLSISIRWSRLGVTISTDDGAALPLGRSVVELTATAPVDAYTATLLVGAAATTENSAHVEFSITDMCFVEVTDYDQDPFFGTGESHLETLVRTDLGWPTTYNYAAFRRLPRPFLIRRVRKASEGPRAPEVQNGRNYRRDFTMGLRAADPRIYVVDERRQSIQMTGTPTFVGVQAPSGFTLDSTTPPVPTGFTYEGHNLTHPGTGALYRWSQRASAYPSPISSNPAGGVILRAFDEGGSSTAFGSNRPANDLKARVYRSAEGYTYNTPRVIVGGSPGSNYGSRSLDPHAMSIADVSGSAGSRNLDGSSLVALLKRVSSTTWIELRWNSWSLPAFTASGYGSEPQVFSAFELWCSHNSSGTLSTTRLANWDYTSYDSSSALYLFNRLTDPMWLTTWMSNQTVYWQLWSSYPRPFATPSLLESGSYAIPAGLQSTIGTSVAGSTGWGMYIEKSNTQLNFNVISYTPPYLHYFESSDAALPPQQLSIPVIGSIDTEPILELRGDLVDPIITISTAAFDGKPASQTTARFVGTAAESNPVYIDLRYNTIIDSLGISRDDMLVPGSSFARLTPGVNTISVQAKGWGSYNSHVAVTWRDALKSG